jgi:hypothetical protein
MEHFFSARPKLSSANKGLKSLLMLKFFEEPEDSHKSLQRNIRIPRRLGIGTFRKLLFMTCSRRLKVRFVRLMSNREKNKPCP